VGIAAGAPQGSAVNEVEVAMDQFSEGILRLVVGVSAEQRSIIAH
jgi:hypothetical protein